MQALQDTEALLSVKRKQSQTATDVDTDDAHTNRR